MVLPAFEVCINNLYIEYLCFREYTFKRAVSKESRLTTPSKYPS